MFNLSDNLVRQIGLLYRYMMRALEAETAPLGMGAGRFSYLFILYINEGVTQQDIAYRLQADKAAVARTLVQLEIQGFIERRSDPSDGRVTRVYLTDKSRAMQADLEAAVERVIDRLNLDRNDNEQGLIRDELKAMLTSLDDHYQVSSNSKP
ncbi:MAG: MarR family transcriptional regulator [Porticoccaceae bacterium]|nr:MarR family transcriptional regulator [Porticoccaceae bacterium]